MSTPIPADTIRDMLAYYQRPGVSSRDAADRYGVSMHSLLTWAHRLGVPVKKRGRHVHPYTQKSYVSRGKGVGFDVARDERERRVAMYAAQVDTGAIRYVREAVDLT